MKISNNLVERISSKYSVSKKEVEEILEGFKVIDDSIILLTQLSVITPVFINVQYDLLEDILKSSNIYYLLFNPKPKLRPDALSRRTLNARLIKSKNLIKYIAFGNCTNQININATQFMMATCEIINYSIHDTEEEAIKKLKEVSRTELYS